MYRLPDFHLTCSIWEQNPRGTITGLRQSGVSCQLVGIKPAGFVLLKLPAGTQIKIADGGAQSNFIGDLVNIADRPSVYWEAITYARVAAGYANEYDAYSMRFTVPPGGNPHA